MTTRIYDPNEISVSLAGVPLSGFADGEFISIAMESDAFSDVVGTDGEVSRSKSNDRRATITISLMQTSPSNDRLSALHNLDLAANNGAGVGAFLVRDRNGTSVFEADECWIMKAPDVSFDRTATSREWTLRAASLNRFDGSN